MDKRIQVQTSPAIPSFSSQNESGMVDGGMEPTRDGNPHQAVCDQIKNCDVLVCLWPLWNGRNVFSICCPIPSLPSIADAP